MKLYSAYIRYIAIRNTESLTHNTYCNTNTNSIYKHLYNMVAFNLPINDSSYVLFSLSFFIFTAGF